MEKSGEDQRINHLYRDEAPRTICVLPAEFFLVSCTDPGLTG